MKFYNIFQMFSRKSFDSISFELTQKNLDLPSKSIIQSPLKLEYSHSNISINEMMNAQPQLFIHIQHQPTPNTEELVHSLHFEERHSHIFELSENLRKCFGSFIIKGKVRASSFTKLKPHHRIETDHPNSLSNPKREKQLRSRSNDSQNSQNKHPSQRNRAFLHSKALPLCKENLGSSDRLRREDGKNKFYARQNIFCDKEISKKVDTSRKKLRREDFQELMNAVTAKRLNLNQNEPQQRKYCQKMNLNRQNILQNSHKVCLFPIL